MTPSMKIAHNGGVHWQVIGSGTMKRRRLALALLLLLFPLACGAASVRQLSVAELLAASEFVFEGRVVGRRAAVAETGKAIHTYVSFEVTDLIKGPVNTRTLELRFLGGRLGRRALVVSEMAAPGVGEQGIYFVERLSGEQVHPLTGWDQGRFPIQRDGLSGRRFVATGAGEPVFGLALDPALKGRGLSRGVAAGVETDMPDGVSAPLSPFLFKQLLRRGVEHGGQR